MPTLALLFVVLSMGCGSESISPRPPAQKPAANTSQVDRQIANTILTKLKAEKDAGNLKGFSIDLNVEPDGTVWLMGRTSSEEQQSLVLNIAARVKGVKQVVNALSVEKVDASK